jgi:hypothetical protein
MRTVLFIALAAVLFSGCGQATHKNSSHAVTKGESGYLITPKELREPGRFAADKASLPNSSPAERKIIHDIAFDIVVTDFSDVPATIDKLIAEFAGSYVANMSLSGSEGESRYGRWEIRVPNSGQASFLDRVRELGTVAKEERKADDVSEEFYDLEARLKNKRETEARLLKVQQERTGELKDILEVEQQIDRVRGEIEQMQGRLDRLGTLTSLSTVTIAVREIRNYKPPQAVSLVDRVTGTFDSSVDGLREFGEEALLLATALVPWSPLIVAGFFAARWVVRRLKVRLLRARELAASAAKEPSPVAP